MFLHKNLINLVMFSIKEKNGLSKGSLIHLFTILHCMIDYKPYAVSRSTKIEALGLLLERYEGHDEPGFKRDLIEMLR